MPDLIRIVDLEVFAYVGVPDEERATPQRLLISLEMAVDAFSGAAETDDVARTVDYHEVAQRMKAFASGQPRKLLETLADELTFELLACFPIKKITLEIKKFILPDAGYVSVQIERTNIQK